MAPGDGALRDPRNWPRLRNPMKPSWGEPYDEVATRMTAALHRARLKAEGVAPDAPVVEAELDGL